MFVWKRVLSIALLAAALCVPTLWAAPCDPPAYDSKDWENLPLAYGWLGSECEGEAPLSGPAFESYFGDDLPQDLDGLAYSFRIDTSNLQLAPTEEVALFQLRSGDDRLVTILALGGPLYYQIRIEWQADIGPLQWATPQFMTFDKDLTVFWVIGEGSKPGNLEVLVGPISVVDTEVDNDLKLPTEARIGVVDDTRYPTTSTGSILFGARMKLWHF